MVDNLSRLRIPPFHWWRTVFFLIPAISIYTIVLGSVSILSSLVERRGRVAHACARLWSWLILKTTNVRVHLEGAGRVREDVSYVFAANHQSIYDIPIVFASIPGQLRIVAKASLGRFPFLGWHLRLAGHLLVDRDSPGAGVLKRMGRLVRACPSSSFPKARAARTAASADSRAVSSSSPSRPGFRSCR